MTAISDESLEFLIHWSNNSFILFLVNWFRLLTVGITLLGLKNEIKRLSSVKLECSLYSMPEIYKTLIIRWHLKRLPICGKTHHKWLYYCIFEFWRHLSHSCCAPNPSVERPALCQTNHWILEYICAKTEKQIEFNSQDISRFNGLPLR